MPRKTYSPTVSQQLINFIRLNDVGSLITNPKKWIKSSSSMLNFLNKLKADEASSEMLMEHLLEYEKNQIQTSTDKNHEMRQLAKLKYSDTLALRVWAITYYQHRIVHSKPKKIYKKQIAAEIRALLVADYPELTPSRDSRRAEFWQIPNENTIRTEWLKNI